MVEKGKALGQGCSKDSFRGSSVYTRPQDFSLRLLSSTVRDLSACHQQDMRFGERTYPARPALHNNCSRSPYRRWVTMWSQFKAQGLAQTQIWRRAIVGVRRSGRILASSVLLIFTAFSISAWAQTTINAGDIVVVFGNAFGGSGGIYKIDPAT